MKQFQSSHHGLALTLALALGLGLTGAAAAADNGSSPQWMDGLDLQQVPEEILATFADELAGQTEASQAMAGTITVTNCADSAGSGGTNLRSAVAAAASGDTIDVRNCSNITLSRGQINIPLSSLIIKGKIGSGLFNRPEPTIDALQASRVFNHTGTGTLTLQNVSPNNGSIDSAMLGTDYVYGGCVYSAGNVRVKGTDITNCSAQGNIRASGAGVYAKGRIYLRDSNWIVGNNATAVWYATGGALHSEKVIQIDTAGSLISTNSATITGNGYARGGGVYAFTGMLGAGGLLLQHNTVKGTLSTADIQGGGAYLGTVWANNLEVTENHAVGPGSAGGGLYVSASTLISASTITKNDAAGSAGGFYAVGAADINTSAISDNTAGASGGGIYAEASLTFASSTVADNTASSNGGGLYVRTSSLTVEDSNILGNHSALSGGGISADGNVKITGSTIANNKAIQVAGARLGSATSTSPITIDQSTISGNASSNSQWGAGLYLKHDAVIRNSTIVYNRKLSPTGTGFYGAGISLADGVQLTLSSTMVSGNRLVWPMGPPLGDAHYADDIGIATGTGSVYDILGSHNMIGFSGVTVPPDTIGQSNDVSPSIPRIENLADNGGPTLTHLPKPDSVAIDNGKDNGFSCDQRDAGFARVVGFSADIGAVEVQDDENTDRIFANGFEAAPTSCD